MQKINPKSTPATEMRILAELPPKSSYYAASQLLSLSDQAVKNFHAVF